MADDRLKIWLSFLKFLLGTLAVGIVTTAINSKIQNREVALKEQEHLSKFMDTALGKDIGPRLLMARYFANVTQSDELKAGWKTYLDSLEVEAKQKNSDIQAKKKRLAELELAIEKGQPEATTTPRLVEVRLLKEDLLQLEAELDPRGRFAPPMALELVTGLSTKVRQKMAFCGGGINVSIRFDEQGVVTERSYSAGFLGFPQPVQLDPALTEQYKKYSKCVKETMDEDERNAMKAFIENLKL